MSGQCGLAHRTCGGRILGSPTEPAAGMNEKGTPYTAAYSREKWSSSSVTWLLRRSARPTTCSQSNWVPKALTPRTWETVLASQPSVSIETDTTHRTSSPRRPGLPTVFITSRSRSSSVSSSGSRPGKRARYSALNSAISVVARRLNSSDMPSPDSSWAESTRIVTGLPMKSPSATFEKRANSPGTFTVVPSDNSFSWPAT